MQYTFFIYYLFNLMFYPQADLDTNQLQSSNPEFELQYVIKTNRISSGLFCENVIDEKGNVYISSFIKSFDGNDRPYFAKFNLNGEQVWEKVLDTRGRATSVTINEKGFIWVAGVYNKTLEIDNHNVYSPDQAMFLAKFNSDGFCLSLKSSLNNALPADIHSGGNGQLLVGGLMGSELQLDSYRVLNEGKKDIWFLGKVGSDDICNNLEKINGTVHRVKSDSKGNFVIGGSFKEDLYTGVGDHNLEPISKQPRGFLLTLNSDMGVEWSRLYEAQSFKESIVDFTRLANGHLAVLRQLDTLHTSKLFIDLFTDEGIKIESRLLHDRIKKRTVSTIAQHPNQSIWVSTKMALGSEILPYKKTKQEREGKALLMELTTSGRLIKKYEINHGRNTLIRSADSGVKGITFSGHFQDSIAIQGKKLMSDGNHSIFLLKL